MRLSAPRIPRLLKRSGLLLFVGALAVGVVSSRYGVIYINHPHQAWIELDVGAVHVGWVAHSAAFASTGLECLPATEWNWSGWLPRIDRPSPGGGFVTLPVWLLALPLLFPTLLQITRPARSLATACNSCGYDLTGNESGVCPECGIAMTNATA